MEQLRFKYQGHEAINNRAHVGVVGSGDLEVLFEPIEGDHAEISVITGSDGFEAVWEKVLNRFFTRYPLLVKVTIHDFGATPGVVSLRLAQALEELKNEK
ncbi:malonate decarboxylase acyl carrier protein [Ignatzschineria ureiclastica]|uniref:Malonate decarboxylase acyl carrier protein n=1 Tax=Ignatzschineria ureiclastica TaxID=472582 RepID=A0A2U2AGT8_9GAMM|nr:malonate decarboxylase subunit delta [Ignatzschineria ureiclastica]PWD81861.1 malonate decarboxylase acyl carrier protein [Ignatzschineria ureiclastica]GGZ91020.1 malonate decarboxylase acyl carrier protein [Ignatzschineria ureiclastica]